MADHAALQALSLEAFAAASHYISSTEGWTVIDSSEGFTTSLHPTDNNPVLKVEGDLNKDTKFVTDFIRRNVIRIKETYFSFHVSQEIIQFFEDTSALSRETLNIPGVGEFVQVRYYSKHRTEDSLNVVASSVINDQFPSACINLVFYVLNLVPNGDGLHVKFIMKSNSEVQMSDDERLASALVIKNFYIGMAKEINSAVIEQ